MTHPSHAARHRTSLVVVLGPTTTGKTSLALDLARHLDGELVNADKFHLVDGLSVGTGRSDAEAAPDVPRHLFGVLHPTAGPPDVGWWCAALERVVADVRARGRVPVVEGSSFGLASAAARLAARTPGAVTLGLRWRSAAVLGDQVAARVDRAWDAGLVDETDRALQAGWGESWVMRRSVVFPAVVDHLAARCTRAAACERVGDAVVAAAQTQALKFEALSGVRWFDHPDAARMAVS